MSKCRAYQVGFAEDRGVAPYDVTGLLKGVGTFWIEHNAEGFLHIRSYLKAGRWDIMEKAVIEYEEGRA